MGSIEERVKHQKELQERRRLWEEDFARKQEAERLQNARDELAAEKQRRLTFWMESGGDPADFAKAWPSMMQQIVEERYALEQHERLSGVEDLFA
jgi:hypothetical protein